MKSPATKNPNRPKFGSATEFASFGNGALSYVRRVRSDDLNHRFPNAVDLPEGLDLWGLFAADGAPIAVSDEEAELIHNAHELHLVPLMRQ